MVDLPLSKLKRIFDKHREVKLVYFFGSRADGKAGPLITISPSTSSRAGRAASGTYGGFNKSSD